MKYYNELYELEGVCGIKKEITKLLREEDRITLSTLLDWWSPIQDEISKVEKEERGLNNYHGFLDSKDSLQSGRIKKTLSQVRIISNNGVKKGYYRKEFIESFIKNGWTFDNGKFSGYRKMKNGELKLVDLDGFLIINGNDSYEITKTEYDYGNYLLEKKQTKL